MITNGYQPKKRCDNCLRFGACNKSKFGRKACTQYEEQKPSPPKSGSCVTSTYTPPPMPEVKPPKQRTILSVRDFAILYEIITSNINNMRNMAQTLYWYNENKTKEEQHQEIEQKMRKLQEDPWYQDLLRIRDKLGELNIEVETPIVEVKDDAR